jgi:heme O synthase-like polyprenyltransferase
MKTTTLPVSRQQFPSWSVPIARVPDFIALTKPRVMVLAVFTAAVGLFTSPGHLDPLPGAVALIGIAVGAGAAGVPMLPVVSGSATTARQILTYCVLLVPTTMLPCVLGFAGAIHGATAAAGGAVFIALGARLSRSRGTDRRAAQRLFVFSISYLFLLFAALLAGHQIDRWSTTVATYGVRIDLAPVVHAERLTSPVRAIQDSTRFIVGEA